MKYLPRLSYIIFRALHFYALSSVKGEILQYAARYNKRLTHHSDCAASAL